MRFRAAGRWLLSVVASWIAGLSVMLLLSIAAGELMSFTDVSGFALFIGVPHAVACLVIYTPVVLLLRSEPPSSRLVTALTTGAAGLVPLMAIIKFAAYGASIASSSAGLLFGAYFVAGAAAFGAMNARRMAARLLDGDNRVG